MDLFHLISLALVALAGSALVGGLLGCAIFLVMNWVEGKEVEKMKKTAQWIVAIIVMGVALAIADSAICYDCLGTTCYDASACLPGCSCLVAANDDASGICVGIY